MPAGESIESQRRDHAVFFTAQAKGPRRTRARQRYFRSELLAGLTARGVGGVFGMKKAACSAGLDGSIWNSDVNSHNGTFPEDRGILRVVCIMHL